MIFIVGKLNSSGRTAFHKNHSVIPPKIAVTAIPRAASAASNISSLNVMFLSYPRRESNSDYKDQSLVSYPLDHGGLICYVEPWPSKDNSSRLIDSCQIVATRTSWRYFIKTMFDINFFVTLETTIAVIWHGLPSQVNLIVSLFSVVPIAIYTPAGI